jgi:putative addiction module component (TIGR02574 family)
MMTPDELLAEFMRIPPTQRRALAFKVLDDTDAEDLDPKIEASHLAELERRRVRIESGEVTYSPWEAVEARVFGRDG